MICMCSRPFIGQSSSRPKGKGGRAAGSGGGGSGSGSGREAGAGSRCTAVPGAAVEDADEAVIGVDEGSAAAAAASSVFEGMKQKEQQKVLEDFRQGLFNVLLATCIGEEGLDIPQVSHGPIQSWGFLMLSGLVVNPELLSCSMLADVSCTEQIARDWQM